MNLSGTQILAIGAVGIAGAVLYFGARKVGAAVNPANPDNVVNRGVSAIGAAVTGEKHFSLGSAIYDFFHPAYDPNQAIRGPLQ